MLKMRTAESGKTGSLAFDGEMSVEHAEELKAILLDALKSRRSLELDLEGVNKVDMFGLQVLCSAHRFAFKADKKLTLIGKQPEALRDAIVLAGYGRAASCSEDKICPWNEQ